MLYALLQESVDHAGGIVAAQAWEDEARTGEIGQRHRKGSVVLSRNSGAAPARSSSKSCT